MPVEPPLGDLAQPLGAAGEVDEVVHLGQRPDGVLALGQQRVVVGTGEERPPVLRSLGDVVQPVPDVGDHAVDVDDREHPGAVGAHGRLLPRGGKAQPTRVRTVTTDPVRPLLDLQLGRDPAAQLGDVADDADRAATGAQPVEAVHHVVERVGVEGAEALVDEQRVDLGAAGLVGDHVGQAERERRGTPRTSRRRRASPGSRTSPVQWSTHLEAEAAWRLAGAAPGRCAARG